MTWERRSGVVTADGVRVDLVTAFLTSRRALGVVESHDGAFESVHLTLATDPGGAVALLADDGLVVAGADLGEFAAELAEHVTGEVTFGESSWVSEQVTNRGTDPFEQPLGEDIAAFADRAIVFTRAPEDALPGIAAQVDDDIHAIAHLGGHVLCITEGPILSTLHWEEETTPVVIIEHGAATPSVTVIPSGEREAHGWWWGSTAVFTPTGVSGAGAAFLGSTLGRGALVRELMRVFPAAEPGAVNRALDADVADLLVALMLPAGLVDYLTGEQEAADLAGAVLVHPASFAQSVRRVVSEASTSVSERADAMRRRAVAVRTRAETAFDAAEAFAEEVVLPVRQNWVSPALAVAETALGVLALRRARRIGGARGGALGTGGVLLLGDAAVNAVIAVAPLLRRKN